MIALVDTNVVLDVMLARKPFVEKSSAVLGAVETSQCHGLLCATTITTIHYLASRYLGNKQSLERTSDLLAIFEIAAVNRAVIESATKAGFQDFEDAVLHEAAVLSGADCIVARNTPDFKNAKLLVYTPEQFMLALA